ncbi:MAG: hypothetical protein AAF267_03040 [Deinococcota bacterium]
MKRIHIASVLLLALFLAACSESGEVSDFTFSTNHTANGLSIICDDDSTNLRYSFTYTPNLLGELRSWDQELVGEDTGEVRFTRRFFPSDDQVTFEDTTYTVNTVIPSRTAPLTVDGQAIIVEPIVKGQSRLVVEVNGTLNDTQIFRSRAIDVVDCF